MAVAVEWVRYGREAAQRLRAHLGRVKGSEPLNPATVVVPSNHVGVATRRLLASGALGPVCGRGVGLAAVSFVTPYRLAELLGAPALAAAGRRPVSTPVIAAALRGALAERPGLLGPVASHPATESALVSAYRELREVSTAGLEALAAAGPRAGDVVRLHRAARALLAPGWYDEQDLMAAATSVLRRGGRRDLGAVIVYLPQRLAASAASMLAAAAEGGEVTVVAGVTGHAAADAAVADGLRRLTPSAPPPPAFEPHEAADASRTRIVTASDADDETRAAVRAVIGAVRTGTPLDRIALLHAGAAPYSRLAHEQLEAAGIATNGAAVVPLAARVAGRTLLDLLALPERHFRRQDVLAWLTSSPVCQGGQPAPVSAWERLSREAGVVAGRHDWDERLAALDRDLEARADAAAGDPDTAPGAVERRRQDGARAGGLRAFILELIDDLSAASARPRRWSEHAAWASARLHALLGDASGRTGWPEAERKGAERTEAALGRLAALDAVEGAVALDVFTRTLALELERDLGRVGRFGEGVLVGSVALGIGLDLDLVVVLGLAEGSLPLGVREDSLLADSEREAAGGGLALRRDVVDDQHRQLLAVLAGPGRRLLGVPRGDLRRSTERTPSRWVLDLASALAGRTCWADDLRVMQAPWVDHVASFEAGLGRLDFPATGQEHRLRSLMAAGAGTAAADDLARSTADPALKAGAVAVAARRSSRFTRFDGNLSGLAVPSPVSTGTSATRLERWAGCPFAYLVHDVLGVEATDNPEDELEITPIERGNLVHQALERFFVEVLARAAADQPVPDQAWSGADRARMATIGEELCGAFEARGLTGRPLFWRRHRVRILADLARFLEADDLMRRRHRTRPAAAELAFGLRGGALDAVAVPLPDGRLLQVRGKADRVDVADDGSLHILDYKTGRSNRYRDLSEEEPDQHGRRLQLPIYGLAARLLGGSADTAVLAEYWFVSARGAFDRIGYPITDDVLARVGATLGTIVDGIEAGVFPARPTASSSTPRVECPACDPDGLGVSELRRAWERKCPDPALTGYAALAEPFAGVQGEIEHEVLDGP